MNDFDTLVHLADNLYSRYETHSHLSDLSLCIVHYRSALTLSKSSANLSNDARGKLLGNLANALSVRFQYHGDMADLDHSVECHLTALDFRPPGHPGRANILSNFATALLIRYGKLGIQKDIELAIEHFNTALSILPPEHRLVPLTNYASALFSRFQFTGDASDLNDAIHQYHAMLKYPSVESPLAPYYNLANALLARFKLQNHPEDLELCIEYSSAALQGMVKGHPDHLLALSCFSTALIKRFELQADPKDLQTAVETFKFALTLRSSDDPQQFIAFYELADALMKRYELQSDLPDLELAIRHYRTSLNLLPPDHNDDWIFENLGNALFLRFSRLGALCDLEEAIQKLFSALEIHSSDLRRRVITLQALGTCLNARFEQFRDHKDLHSAIDLYNEALNETFQDHPRRTALLQRSASSLETRFRVYGGTVDLHRSISYCREVLELLPSHHPDLATTYQTLASSLLLRFEESGDEFDLDEALLYCSTSMDMGCASDLLRATRNLLLAQILKARIIPWEAKDIESIFQHLRIAKALCALTHPLISDIYAELASTYYLRFLVEERPSDLHEAFGHHELSMSVPGCSLWPALRASLQWARGAEMYGHRSGIDVYRNALRLVNLCVLERRSPELRQRFAEKYGASLAYDGASFALRFQELVAAIEIFEGGRSILWSQLVRAKTCLDELRLMGGRGVPLADSFERISFQLERVFRVSKSHRDVKSLLKEKEVIIDQIRRIEGFKYFLKVTPFSEFEKVASDGPVVILNASLQTCDALILLHNTPPIHVPFSHLRLRDVSQMATRFQELAGNLMAGGDDDEALEGLLSDLWDLIVSPIVERLLPLVPTGSRLWWCPGGAFASLPLHAAGPYKRGEPSLSQIYVSSYTPTLQALVRARAGPAHTTSQSRPAALVRSLLRNSRSKTCLTDRTTPNIVVIGDTASDTTCRALDLLRACIPPEVSFRRMEGEEVISEAVLAVFREPAWLHIACPALFYLEQPCHSGFVTRNGTLSLRDISAARPRAEFVFLSGQCDRGDDAEVEEVMHLAASLQCSGVRSVIGTFSPVDDEVMQRVAAAFYEEIRLKEGELTQYTHAARSLNEALKGIGKGVTLAQKIAFVHVGA